MSNGGGTEQTRLQGLPPPTRAPQAWKHVITTMFHTIPQGIGKSAAARNRMLRGR